MEREERVTVVKPGSFDPENHFYPRVLNAQIHPVVRFFFNIKDVNRIVSRYKHLHPSVNSARLIELLTYKPKYFKWAGADLFATTSGDGYRRMMVIETNSCPSGQKSTPFLEEIDQGGYIQLMERTFSKMIDEASQNMTGGRLAVIYDKNHMEASGYACAMADLTGEDVYLAHMPRNDPAPAAEFGGDGTLFVDVRGEGKHAIRAAFRYVTQAPWDRIPLKTKTVVLNPVIACLAGGRNKLVASKAYDLLNSSLAGTGLFIRTPETIWDVSMNQIPMWVERMGGLAVVKNPYSNAGQGVWSIANKTDIAAFKQAEHVYSKFIVQQLVGNSTWYKHSKKQQSFHVGTVPDKQARIYIADLRMMVHATEDGYRPLAMYARRARLPMAPDLPSESMSWETVGTNLSVKKEDGSWDTDTTRLLLMDSRDFNKLGLGIDDLIDSYIQTVLSAIAIDMMAARLVKKDGSFDLKLFRSLNPDAKLIEEITRANDFPAP